jgi:hypothetical protein
LEELRESGRLLYSLDHIGWFPHIDWSLLMWNPFEARHEEAIRQEFEITWIRFET